MPLTSAELLTGLVSYYPFNTGAVDIVGVRNGTVDGASLTSNDGGRVDEAYDFDGTNDYIDNLYNPSFVSTDATISFWLYNDNNTNFDTLFDGTTGSANGFRMRFPTLNKLEMVIYGNTALTSSTINISEGQWTHIVAVWSAATRNLQVYKNGTLVYSGTKTDVPIVGAAVLELGRQEDGSLYYDGKIDELGFWNRTLNTDEVEWLYNNGAGIGYPFVGTPETEIERGISLSIIGDDAQVYNNTKVLLRNVANTQVQATATRIATHGDQRWLFHYGNASAGLFNITPSVYVLELINVSAVQIAPRVQAFINNTVMS